MKRRIMILAVAGLALLTGNTGSFGQTPATSSLPPELQELVMLAQNNISDEIIISYIRNSGKTYRLTADDIVNLGKNGVSQNVIAKLIQSPASSTTTATVVTAPVAPVTVVEPSGPAASPEYFEAQLAPYGEWIYVPEFGTRCWFPAGLSPDWRPYFDSGHWLYTDNGMYWESDYPWGAVPFHYGRWIYRGSWLWVPAYEYAPAWVVWRHTEGHMGWAPVPPGAVFVGGGWQFHGRSVAMDFDFGLSPTLFIFVGGQHVLDHDFHRHELRGGEWHQAYTHSSVNRLARDTHGHGFHVEGLEHDHVEALVGHKVEPVRRDDVRSHTPDNLNKNETTQPKSVATPKVITPASVTTPVQRSHDSSQKKTSPIPTPIAMPESNQQTEPKAETVITPKTTPVPPTQARPRYYNQQTETRDLPARSHSEAGGRNPAHEEKTGRTDSKPAAVENPATPDNTNKTTPSDSRRKHKDSDSPSGNQY